VTWTVLTGIYPSSNWWLLILYPCGKYLPGNAAANIVLCRAREAGILVAGALWWNYEAGGTREAPHKTEMTIEKSVSIMILSRSSFSPGNQNLPSFHLPRRKVPKPLR
jgi:hypothetical protein